MPERNTPTQHIRPVQASTFTTCMEQLQEGYVMSVAATAGCTVNPISRDVNGVDLLLVRRGSDATQEEASVYVQLKNTTTIVPDLEKATFGFQFKHRSHFDHLAKERETIKALLVVMVSVPAQASWTRAYHKGLLVRRCCYWMNLEGATSNAANPTVHVPIEQRFDADSLTGILDRVQGGGRI